MKYKLLIIDDDPLITQSLQILIPKPWDITSLHSCKNLPQENFHAAFIDLHFPQYSERRCPKGLKIIEKISKINPHTEIIAISGDLTPSLMESCLKAGASRFLAKPLNPDEVLLTLQKIEAWIQLQEASSRPQLPPWIGSSQATQTLKKQVSFLKSETAPILVEGETGCGKEVIAHWIHAQEGFSRPFIQVNISAIPENLFESELFGHIKGAFTGADNTKMGLAEAAHGGDLFLDEIEALSLPMQVKLLRFLETQEVRRIGSTQSQKVQVRVIAATNQNLQQLVDKKLFREDLLWRLKGHHLVIPPLRKRKEDIQTLAKYFLERHKSRKKSLSPDALEILESHQWPGNVRELKQVCERLLVQAPLPIIRKEDVLKVLHGPIISDDSFSNVDLSLGLQPLLNKYEAFLLKKGIAHHQGNIDSLALKLKISRASLYRRLKELRINWKGAS
ncbi:MAG: sigma-54-dependent Fis family transcriptional regulator [Bdellovibrio sp.]|nr:MAG: sigma-54-dependent Fis family transcriptional regulator [Bdellovibrio sp.]